ncbi:MAG: hypothetical protein QNJ54_11475 [Prochloraceae cyanobacterium]|nr:hypothetical protein [Prochloraceae cyanobacterium]
MNNFPIEAAVSHYQAAIDTISESQSPLSIEHILEVFNARDVLMSVLTQQSEISGEIQKQIVSLDTTLKQHSQAISKAILLKFIANKQPQQNSPSSAPPNSSTQNQFPTNTKAAQ